MAKPVYALVNGVWTLVGSTTAHAHTVADVTGLQAAIDAKANIASPTFTGTLTADVVKITGGVPGAGKVLTSDADGDATWEDAAASGIQPTLFDAKGDLIVASAADTATRLAVGTNDQLLVADSSQATGLRWEDKPSAYMPVFYQSGVLMPGVGTNRWYNDTTKPITIVALRATVESAPVGSGIDIDFLVDDVIEATLTITDGTTTSGKVAASVAIPVNSYVTINITSVGSSTPGTGLGITSTVS